MEPTDARPAVRAVVQDRYGGTDVLALTTRATPTPGPGEVTVRVHAAAVDRGTWHVLTGLPRLARLGLGLRKPRRRVPGLDVAGVVERVGADVEGFAVGDRVVGMADGSLTELAVAPAAKLARAPRDLPWTVAATLPISGVTALQALDAGRVGEGDEVLVLGASGGVGMFAVQLAAARDARVTAVCSSPKAAAVRSWGAHQVLDRASDDVLAVPTRFDAVIEIAGGHPARRLRRLLSPTGTHVFVGAETGGTWTGGYLRRPFTAVRYVGSQQRHVMLVSREKGSDVARLVELADAGRLRPHVHATYPLDQVGAALEDLVAGRVTGKVAISVDS